MKLSQRITGLTGGGSDGWDVFNKAREMIADGIPVVELTIGEHDIRTAAPILQEMHRAALAGHAGAQIRGTGDGGITCVARKSRAVHFLQDGRGRANIMLADG
ncbi:MAG: hypothetical protein AAGF27_11810, partial [Pseudomonadota bacterium]